MIDAGSHCKTSVSTLSTRIGSFSYLGRVHSSSRAVNDGQLFLDSRYELENEKSIEFSLGFLVFSDMLQGFAALIIVVYVG